MNCLIARISAAGALLAAGASAFANPPALTPRAQPLAAIPYGYYQTQWRPYPTTIADPEVRLVVPTESPTEPTRTKPLQPPKMDPPPAASPPKKMELATRPAIQQPTPDPRSRILPPGYIPEATPTYMQPMQPMRGPAEARLPRMAPEVRYLNPLPPTGAPVEPQILHLLPTKDAVRQPEAFRNSAEEASEPRKPASNSKPKKAWLELPVPAPTPVVRGSSHSLSEPIKSSPIWQPLPDPR